ncbi:hypothetical protein [Cryptosporangium minutisporangium]|uniref:Uncharacterized protein n=1 Tax=Cryptosporangium minutisporangium TaxID=113569 RepID=A0ABP6TAG3_9ACTN
MLLRASAQGVILDAARDFTTLSLILEGPDGEAAAATVGTWIDRDHLVVPAQTLVDLAGPVVTEIGWRSGFDTMMAHATERGLVDETGGVRIHVEQR